MPGVFLSLAKAGNFPLELAQVLAETAVKSRCFSCNGAAKSLPFAPFSRAVVGTCQTGPKTI
jgi:hypothetical protein